MITRTTTVGSMKTYRYNLNHSLTTMSTSLGKIATGRNFNSFAESPAIAARAFQLRNAYLRTSSQYEANDALLHKYDVAWKALDTTEKAIDTIDNSGFYELIRAENGPDAAGRNALGQSMAAKAKAIIQAMNGRYGENYVFAGADTLNVPFTWGARVNPEYIEDPDPATDLSAFQYLKAGGIGTNDVNEAELVAKENPDYDENFDPAGLGADPDDIRQFQYLKAPDADGKVAGTNTPGDAEQVPHVNEDYNPMTQYKYLRTDGKGTNDEDAAEQALYYRGIPVDSMDSEDTSKLAYYTNGEKKYIDIGIGYKEEDGSVVSSSVRNSALQGVYYLGGYGTSSVTVQMDPDDPNSTRTVDNIPNNIVSIMSRLGTIMMRCSQEDGAFASEEEKVEFMALAKQYEDSSSLVKQRYTELDTDTNFLRANKELLTNNADTLEDQFLGMEDVDPAAAIEDFMFARYAYDTALKVGNSILSQSLMDYMSI